jgi:hypothetical protein
MNISREKILKGRGFEKLSLHWAVECPETGCLAECDFIAEPFPAFCMPIVSIKNCSLWPERKNCTQKCLGRLTEETKGATSISFYDRK